MSKTRNPDALIRIEDAIKVLCREKCHPGALCPDNYCVEMWDEFEDVERVDAVPVVRCKDCRFSDWYTAVDGKRYCYCMEHDSSGHQEMDFCSYGEKDGDGNGV